MGSGLAFKHLMHPQNTIGIKNLTKYVNARPDPHVLKKMGGRSLLIVDDVMFLVLSFVQCLK